jgi:hypothetical protein
MSVVDYLLHGGRASLPDEFCGAVRERLKLVISAFEEAVNA